MNSFVLSFYPPLFIYNILRNPLCAYFPSNPFVLSVYPLNESVCVKNPCILDESVCILERMRLYENSLSLIRLFSNQM